MPFPSPWDLPNPGIKPGSSALQADSLPTELLGKHVCVQSNLNNSQDRISKTGISRVTAKSGSQCSGLPRFTVCSLHDKPFYPDNSLNPHNKFIIPVSQERKGTEPKERIHPSNRQKEALPSSESEPSDAWLRNLPTTLLLFYKEIKDGKEKLLLLQLFETMHTTY